MKKLLAILIVLFVAQTGFGQGSIHDTIKIYWNDSSIYKYLEYEEWNNLKNKDGSINAFLEIRKKYFNQKGDEIDYQIFLKQYGQIEIDKINIALSILQTTKDSVNEKFVTNNLEKQYSDYCKMADEKLFIKEYIDALNFYKRANKIKPTEVYPQDRISQINEILKAKNH